MTTSDWIAALALLVSGAALGLEVRRWFETKPRLRLSVMGDAIQFPADDREPKLALNVINRGSSPTTLTHMVTFVYPSRWKRWRNKPTFAAVVNSPTIPFELGANKSWTGLMVYSPETSKARADGTLYVGVIASHTDRYSLQRVPPEKSNVPKKTI